MIQKTFKETVTNFNVNDFVQLLTSFIIEEPSLCLKNIFRQNILFTLWYKFGSPYVKNFFLRILDPIDNTLNITPHQRNDIYRYVYETRILKEFTSLMLDPMKEADVKKSLKFCRAKEMEEICDFHGSKGKIYTPNFLER